MGEGEGEMTWENGIEICIMSYMKRVSRPGLRHDAGCLGLVHWDNPGGWCGAGWRRVRGRGHVCACGGFISVYGGTIAML